MPRSCNLCTLHEAVVAKSTSDRTTNKSMAHNTLSPINHCAHISPKPSYLWTEIRLSFCSVPKFTALLRGIVRVCVVVGSFICCLRFSDRGLITLIKNLLPQIIDYSCFFFLADFLASPDAVKSFVFPDIRCCSKCNARKRSWMVRWLKVTLRKFDNVYEAPLQGLFPYSLFYITQNNSCFYYSRHISIQTSPFHTPRQRISLRN